MVCLLDDFGRSREERVRVGNEGESLIPSRVGNEGESLNPKPKRRGIGGVGDAKNHSRGHRDTESRVRRQFFFPRANGNSGR